ncbi:MAG: DUF1289 domain-containing protein [Gemmatimonadales bacterium]
MAEPQPVSPCRQICRLGTDGLCDGCGRTVDEIAAWLWLSASQRRAIMNRVEEWEPRL